MKHHVTLMAAVNWVVALFALCFTPVSTALGLPWVGYHWGDWHGFVSPHLVLACGIGVLFSLSRRATNDVALLRAGVLLQPLLAATFLWAMNQWPGGDDGGGMSWMLFMGPLSGLSLVLAAGLAWRLQRRSGKLSGVAERATTAYVMIAAVVANVVILSPWADMAFSLARRQ